ncbi:SIS domain-containing protein [Conexibacter stalactiti]|uniref:SIS domain-containing protein n=1 Tax=Conexibacter stalactiti TaxID=1940611 RepID=A0ABU4HKM5_9ACTN|nr:SIS domain-containing protein [Conexibacter stalactiti]MDW5593871.1 SIS domain-containing protein [Conexibacter stalactiti]MEC5034513.1 SIS domain-containing protein [Conexibacter stalactiti]
MSPAATTGADRLDVLLAARVTANERFFVAEAERLASLCHALAERFARGGRLLAFGDGAVELSDARHVAVEFVHPVIVGKRALPALALAPADVALLARADDIAIAYGSGPEVRGAVRDAAAAGCLTVAFTPVGAAWELVPPSDDPFVAQELAETAYHVLWELVHVFFEHRGLLRGRDAGPRHDSGASSFLYPFLGEQEDDLDAVLADVRASALAKAGEISALRTQTLRDGGPTLLAAARELRARLDGGGTLLALGNGGSATDAQDAVADLRAPPPGRGWPARRALDLTADPAILTAIANDIGTEAIFARQVIAYGGAGDALLALSTSGSSANVLAALAEARRRGLLTIAFVGYDGGRTAAERLADHVVVTRSEHIPRIQEAQASAWHALRELVESLGQSPRIPLEELARGARSSGSEAPR